MELSIILLTWNSKQYIENCINSIYNSIKPNIKSNDFEIIVVDNGSTDDTLIILETHYPEIKVIKNECNRGVAPARNQGLEFAKGEYILILDIDTIVYEGSIQKLIEFMNSNPRAGICGPRLVFSNGEIQNSCRRFPLLHSKVLRRVQTKWAVKLLEKEYYISQMQSGNPFSVDYVIGACQLIRRSALDEAGLLDNNIFYGPEDVDLCLRMWLKGWKVFYIPEATIVHFEQRITKKKIFSHMMLKHIVSLLYFFIKHKYLFSRRGLYRRIGL